MPKTAFEYQKFNCEWLRGESNRLVALFRYDSEQMVKRNLILVKASIESMRVTLDELSKYIEELQ